MTAWPIAQVWSPPSPEASAPSTLMTNSTGTAAMSWNNSTPSEARPSGPPSRFNVSGNIEVCVDSLACANANGVVSNVGAAGCITVTVALVPVPYWKGPMPWDVGVRWEPVARREVVRPVRAPGTVQLDERRVAVVALRTEAFVERVEDYRATVRRCTAAELEQAVAEAVGQAQAIVPSGLDWRVPGAVADTGQSATELDGIDVVVLPASPSGRDLAGVLSALTGLGVLANAVGLAGGDGGPVTTHSVFGGKLVDAKGWCSAWAKKA